MPRIISLDLARGFTVLFIPVVHSVMLYGKPEVHSSAFGIVLSFIAEWPGAQVFMMLMGISFVLSKQKSFKHVLVRGVVLLILGYLLNVLKFVIPYFLGGIPEAFMNDLNASGWESLLIIGDILQFAGIALLILWVIQKTSDSTVIALLLAMFVAFATPTPWGHGDVHALELVIGKPPKVFFPLFPWLMYPLAGMVIGYSLKEFGNKVFVALLPIGCGLMLSALCAGSSFAGAQDDNNFYVPGPWSSLMHLGFVAIWLAMWHFISVIIKNNFIFRFLRWLSKRITLIYIIQWPLICWLLPVIGYHQLNVWESIVVGIDFTLLTILLSLFVSTDRTKMVF